MVIDLQGLKEIINIVLEKYLNNNGLSVETDKDNYWYIDVDEGFNFTQSPKADEICVGSLEDDYNSLIKLLNGQREANILDLERISNLLNVILYETEHSKEKWL